MFGRKKPEAKTTSKPGPTESSRTTSYRVDQDAAPSNGAAKTTSYVNAMQSNGRGYETIN